MKIRLLAAGAVLLLALLCGCTQGSRHFTMQQVQEHLEWAYPGQAVHVEKKGWGSGWRCWFEDLPEAEFQVYVGRQGGDPVPVWHYVLRNDAQEVVWRYYLDAYQDGGGSLDAWESEVVEWADEMYLSVTYSTMAEVRAAAGQLDSFFRWAEGKPHTSLLREGSYELCMEAGLPWNTDQSWNRHVCSHAMGDDVEDILAQCAEPLERYYAYYRLPTDDFTQEELDAFAEEAWPWDMDSRLEIWRGEERLPLELFAGIGLERDAISWGGLYEMLRRLEIPVEGAPEHFTVTGADGAVWEFSYAFHREESAGEDETEEAWYFLREDLEASQSETRRWEKDWIIRGPICRLDRGQFYPLPNGRVRWETVAEQVTGLRFKWAKYS